MRYILKKEKADIIKKKYKNSYFVDTVGLCTSYVSMIINRRRSVPKNVAYTFTKAINNEYEINDLFNIEK